MIQIGQFLDVILASVLIIRLYSSGIAPKYRPFLVFVAYDSLGSLIYLVYFWLRLDAFVDYRALWCALQVISWGTTIWMVYSVIVALLSELPGIRRFSVYFLNAVFGIAIVLSSLTIRFELASAPWFHDSRPLVRVTGVFHVLARGFALAELVTLLSTLVFILFFPIRVPQNLARFAAGLSVFLFLDISVLLLRSYLPDWQLSDFSQAAPGYISGACLLYWVLTINKVGEETDATLGRSWKAIPKDQLVRQLEALNAALLRSREQS